MSINSNNQKQDDQMDLEAIREQLYTGAYADIAKATGYSEIYVKQVIYGERQNEKILKATIELIRHQQESIAKIKVKFRREASPKVKQQ